MSRERTKAAGIEIERTDAEVETWLGCVADRLRIFAHALGGMGAVEGGPHSDPERRAKDEFACELRTIAAGLDALGGRLCTECRMTDVREVTTIGARSRRGA